MQSWRDKWINGQGHCIQGNHTDDTHKGDLGYAFDFKLRPGTKVCGAMALHVDWIRTKRWKAGVAHSASIFFSLRRC